ncbi:MAG: LysM domain-containing protein [Pseudomonadota bacterium]
MVHKISKRLISAVAVAAFAFANLGSALADVINIRDDAPKNYVVKKGDTLWDISSLFLEQPWLWPELWRNNTQIENPHLIYPGDMLRLRWENGVPVLEVVREKGSLVMTPDETLTVKPEPIDVLPWELVSPYIGDDQMMLPETYDSLPSVYGDRAGTPRFVRTDYLLSEKLSGNKDEYDIVRRQREIVDSAGNSLGLQVDKIADAKLRLSTVNEKKVIEVTSSKLEAQKGDKIAPHYEVEASDIELKAAEGVRGELVQNINGNNLSGRLDVVIINLGSNNVSPGTVFGIYEKGVDIEVFEKEESNDLKAKLYELTNFPTIIEQPAYKVGELVVVRAFEKGSYALITESITHLKGGEIIGNP